MSKRANRRIVLHDFKDKKRLEGQLDIELSDGSVLTVPAPELWPDETEPMIRAGENVALGRFLLGEESYEAFLADGGTAALLGSMVSERHGVDPGKSSASDDS